MEAMTVFSDRLTEAMAARGFSMSTLGNAVGQKKQAIQRWASGDVEPRVSMAVALADALNVDLAWLCGQVTRAGVPRKRT